MRNSAGKNSTSKQSAKTSSPRTPPGTARSEYHPEVGLRLTNIETELDQHNVMGYAKQMSNELVVMKNKKQKMGKLVEALKQQVKSNQKLMDSYRQNSDNMSLKNKSQEQKLFAQQQQIKVMDNTLGGVQRDNVTLDTEIGQLKKDYQNLLEAYQQECTAVEEVKGKIAEYRRKLSVNTKQNIELQSRLRSSRVAQDLVIQRYKDVERRNKAVRGVVSGCVRPKVDNSRPLNNY